MPLCPRVGIQALVLSKPVGPCGEDPGLARRDSARADWTPGPADARDSGYPGPATSRDRQPRPAAAAKMPRRCALLLASLLLAAALSATPALGSPAKEKRGWTLNSAGYLLGPHAIDSHRSLQDKHGLSGKRELQPEDGARPGSSDRPLAEGSVVRMIIDFLTFLHLKEAGALERLPELLSAVSPEDLSSPEEAVQA
ncbi:Galanin Peptide [Manis pentadactyla]|nr:Galanin Peptide [Manis pentadactyla]